MGLMVGIVLASAFGGADHPHERLEVRLHEGAHPCVFLSQEELAALLEDDGK